ncbi:MAG TPA: MoxR family ATPase [Methylocella sp.]|nr:MoxR family ATPase [Methylocella sp.]
MNWAGFESGKADGPLAPKPQLSVPDLDDWRERAVRLEAEVGKAILGQARLIRLVTVAIFARGHVLLEGDVGVGKTTLLRAFSRALGGGYARVEGAIDMMPNDLLYYTYLADDARPRVAPGPILSQSDNLSIFFFNEINRARPQVHAVLLRVMAERKLSAFNREYVFPSLQVFADRNLVEREETFELPAAARDRFLMELSMATPQDPAIRERLLFDPLFYDVDDLLRQVGEAVLDYREISDIATAVQQSVEAKEALRSYLLRLWSALLDPASAGVSLPNVDLENIVRGGASPRGLAFVVRAARVRAWLEGRDYLVPEDIREIFVETMAHRVFVDPVYALRGDDIPRQLCRAVLDVVPAP